MNLETVVLTCELRDDGDEGQKRKSEARDVSSSAVV